MSLEIVLIEPEIPQNTGNIARTCVVTNTRLHLIKPLGFSLSEKAVKRAGLDYWSDVDLVVWESMKQFMQTMSDRNLYFATTKAEKHYAQINYPDDCMILFGKETKGLPEDLLMAHQERCIRIPMKETSRSLNLSNSVAIITYEYLRQKNFAGLRCDSDVIRNQTGHQ